MFEVSSETPCVTDEKNETLQEMDWLGRRKGTVQKEYRTVSLQKTSSNLNISFSF
jgi:hypothetical protein